MYLVVGLGNPGPEYSETRHNIGCQVIGEWCGQNKQRLINRYFFSKSCQTSYKEQKTILLSPTTYMNKSGQAVKKCVDSFNISMEKTLLVHDDLDLPVGRMKMVRGGGAGGHKGVLSVMDYLGGRNFPRLKIGIGRPRYSEAIENYVLSVFYPDELSIMNKVVLAAVYACKLFISDGIENAMNHINCQSFQEKEGTNLCKV